MERIDVDVPADRARLRALAAQLADGGVLVLGGEARARTSELDVLLAGLAPPDADGRCVKRATYARVDEDALLTPEDAARPALAGADCDSATKRRACANCTCGLAAQQPAQPEATADAASAPSPAGQPPAKSACGSCYLGDAFRCGGCPYRGLPPFREGEAIQLPADYLRDD